jgi:site-specific DNA recombinase
MQVESAAIDPTKVAIYIRWSTEDQSEGTTLEVQTETCQAYLVSQGWSVNPELVFVDDGYSGGDLNRPAMGRLRQAVTQRLVDCVVVYKLDRLSRSVVDTVNLVCREWENACSIKSAREPIDTTSHAGRMFFYTLVNYAEWERSVIRERTYSGKLRRAREGKNPGMRPPYGYHLQEGGGFAPLPEEAGVVQRIYQMYLSGMGARMIVGSLNREGLRPRQSRSWTQSTVIRILANPAYIGRLVYGRRRRTGSSGGRTLVDPVVVNDQSMIPALVAKADWDAVQAIKAQRPGFGRGTGSGRSNSSESLLTGLVRCRCGSGFTGRATVGLYRYYRCMGVHAKGSGYCDCGSIRQEMVDDLVVQRLRSLYSGQAVKERLLKQVVTEWEHRLEEARTGLEHLRRELRQLESGEQRLKRLLRNGELSVTEYRELREDLEQEWAGMRESVVQLERTEREAQAALHSQGRIRKALDEVDAWDRLSAQGRKQLLRQFIQEIRLFRERKAVEIECQVVWRWTQSEGSEGPC